MIIHDLHCPSCSRIELDHIFNSHLDTNQLPHCRCGAVLAIRYGRGYSRAFGGTWGGRSSDKITVWEHPSGDVKFPARADVDIPARYKQQGYQRRELMPSEVTEFEKKHGVACESLHWDRNGKADREDPIPQMPEPKYEDLLA